jgi:hypothetical protein
VTSESIHLLGIDVDTATVDRWRRWFAPRVQPFVVDDTLRQALGDPETPTRWPLELQDTFWLYGDETHARLIGLERHQFDALSTDVRARLVRHQFREGRQLVPSLRSVTSDWRKRLRTDGDGHRFVWWPDTLHRCGDGPLLKHVAEDSALPSRHQEVSAPTWKRANATLPGARNLAGTFAAKSGPNCFGTVMAAAGVPGAADVWMLREPFEEWLTSATQPGGDDREPGTVMVWRDQLGAVQHAAVTLGDGWALHKPSQGWMTPRVVLSVAQVKHAVLQVGHRLSRRAIA